MITLSTLTNSSRPKKKIQRVGRGPGSKRGKTSCRGEKGQKSRSGYKVRAGQEGGQLPLFRKLPVRGFSNKRFANRTFALNFSMINKLFNDNETVDLEALRTKGFIKKNERISLKILAHGTLEKKVSFVAHAYSKEAQKVLDEQKIAYKVIIFNQTESKKGKKS